MLTLVIGTAECLLREEGARVLLGVLSVSVEVENDSGAAAVSLHRKLRKALDASASGRRPIELPRGEIEALRQALGQLEGSLSSDLRVLKAVVDDSRETPEPGGARSDRRAGAASVSALVRRLPALLPRGLHAEGFFVMIGASQGGSMLKAELLRTLEEAGVAYEQLHHERTDTAAGEAHALGVSPEEVAKTLVLDSPDGHIRVVLPASSRVDMHKLSELLGVAGKQLRLATEEELVRDYPEFELGAVPPFGGRRAEAVIVDDSLARRDSIVVEAGSHEDSIRLSGEALLSLTGGRIADVCQD